MVRPSIAAVFLLWAQAALSLDDQLLPGTWSMKTDGPSHATMTLRNDHTVATVVYLTKAFDKKQDLWSGEGTWQLEGTSLVVKYTKSKQGKIFEEKHEITEISDSALRLKSAKGESVEYLRAP